MSDYPSELKYSKEHEWCRIENGKAVVGITRFAVEQLGDVTQLEFPEEGEKFDKEQVFGTVESVKAVSDLFAPLSGKITRVNTPLHDQPENVNEAPYDEGWMVEIEFSDPSQVEELMTQEQYLEYLKEQE